jgi:hypothetical protein
MKMAGKEGLKVPFDKGCFMQLLKVRKLSIRKLEKDPNFEYSAKSISRGFKAGKISFTFMHYLTIYFGVSERYFDDGNGGNNKC